MVTFQRERAQDCFIEAKPMLEAHWDEVAHYKDIPLDPEWSLYEIAEDQGHLRAYSIRDGAELKGYAVFFVRANIHYRGSLQAVQDILFVHPKYRMRYGGRFIKWCDAQLTADGVQAIYHHVKCAIDFGPLLARLGYEKIETVWAKRTDKER